MRMTNNGLMDHAHMTRALEIAERGRFTTKPNPVVGCLIVKGSEVIAEGWHERAGDAHAEVNALRAAGEAARDAQAIVTLEPCSHIGRTGPCVEALISAGIVRVAAAMQDPNPAVAGRGFQRLRDAGMEVVIGIEGKRAAALNPGFIRRMQTGRPRVRVKLAASMDGRTAASDGSSQWISSEASREDVHRLRAGSCAVVTGMGTVNADNPRLNARLTEPIVQPLRVIIDSTGQLSTKAALFDVDGSVLVASAKPRRDKGDAFDSRTETIMLPDGSGRVDLVALIDELGRRRCNEVLVEAGAGVAGAFAAAGLIDELLIYLAPDLLGLAGRGMFALPEVVNLENRLRFEISQVKQLGRDLRIKLRPGRGET